MINLIPAPVLLAIFGAAIALALPRRPGLQRLVSVASMTGIVAVAATFIWYTHTHGELALWVAGWDAPLGIALVVDRLSALMLFVASVVALAVLVFATGQDQDEVRRETPVSIFHPTFLLLMAGVSNAFLAGDLFNLFVGFEILLFASYVLLTLGGTADRVRAGTIYVVVSLLSSIVFLTAIVVVYASTGTVNMAQLSLRLAEIDPTTQNVVHGLLLVAFGIKAAVFPLSAWLPDSYPTAPAPVTAVFAGLLTKVGVYAIIRTETLLVPAGHLNELIAVIAILTMIVGILGAVAQEDLKRLLSFTLVSHIGYMMMGIGLATIDGLAGTIYYTAHHITIQAILFLVAGLIQRVGGSSNLDRLSGLMTTSPLLAALFIVPGMNLAGIPPFSGFIGKLGLLSAGVRAGTPLAWALVAASVVTSLLTLYAIAKVWNRAFWGTPIAFTVEPDEGEEESYPGRPMPAVMVTATLGLIAFSLLLTLVAGPFYAYTNNAAAALLDGAYARAVIGEVVP